MAVGEEDPMVNLASASPASGGDRWALPIKRFLAAAVTAASLAAGTAHAESLGPVTPQAKKMVRLLDSMGVERKWQARVHVDWATGLPAGEQSPDYRGTHCSGFVDAVALRLKINAGAPDDRLVNPSANRQAGFLRS